MSFITFFILRFIRFKNESKHLSAENKKLKKTIDKVFKDAENYNNLYIKTMNEYERLRDAVIKDLSSTYKCNFLGADNKQ